MNSGSLNRFSILPQVKIPHLPLFSSGMHSKCLALSAKKECNLVTVSAGPMSSNCRKYSGFEDQII